MSKIRILPDALASQVAAGEVVERPAAVIRELVENSLDAGAKHVEVHVQRGGAALIRIVDDGGGMDREDALLCIERHATSKIRTKEDLAAIQTFGFRGEALPSIASVARFRLATREASALSGTEIEIHGGKMQHVRDYGGAPGTVIEVRSLFFNVPARRKFLRTENTEYSHVEQQFRLHAIANPHVAFTLTRDGDVMFHLPAANNMLERIRSLSGDELAGRLIEVEREERRGITIHGFIGGAGLSRSTKQFQLTFLNGRPIESPSIHYGLREGYHTVLMKGQNPVTFLFLEMDPHAFDVNVHPAKKEVRFHDGHTVREVVAAAVSNALAASRTLPTGHPSGFSRQAVPTTPETESPTPPLQLRSQAPSPPPPAQTFLPIDSRQHQAPPPPQRLTPTPRPVVQAPTTISPAPKSPPHTQPPPDSSPAESEADSFRIIGVLHHLYVLMENKEGLVLMDQHAAHERVMFEQMRRAMEEGGVPSQRLLIPITLQVSPQDADLINRNIEALSRLGIEAEPFGPNIFKVEALPTFLKTDDPMEWLDQVIEELKGMSGKASSLRLGEDMIATTVCRHAVKANDPLSIPELTALLKDLFLCEMPYCCPHGRPTLIQITAGELEKKFGRRTPG
ncbi:MAG: DNA mismatch repair endonuclease MutL [Verrucomicrobiales bacterium]|nr:DNA mismatch repair endonuclease MutL [Verrucomicrobiales bacterium]MCP5560788.1 DNA mismatch repair endonuclease MutL [Verrucomicrobiaceae bacterium]